MFKDDMVMLLPHIGQLNIAEIQISCLIKMGMGIK